MSVLGRVHSLSVSTCKTSDVANDKVKRIIDKLGQFFCLVHLKKHGIMCHLDMKSVMHYVCTCTCMHLKKYYKSLFAGEISAGDQLPFNQ